MLRVAKGFAMTTERYSGTVTAEYFRRQRDLCMGQIILHESEAFISEDREYYFSGERDKHNQVRPDQRVYSTTLLSDHLDYQLDDAKVGNFFFPARGAALDRIYIGPSICLFANNWGASLLLELLKVLKPGGSIVLPVYPEGQAAEKGYWSRSFLENIFLSRTRWRGMSNIYAENDGVMSMRVGRKWPDPIPSTAEWFFQQRSNLLLHSILGAEQNNDTYSLLQEVFVGLCKLICDEYRNSALLEQIISEQPGGKNRQSISVGHVGQDYGLLVTDLLLGKNTPVSSGATYHVGACNPVISQSVSRYFSGHTDDSHAMHVSPADKLAIDTQHDVLCISTLFAELGVDQYQKLVKNTWSKLKAGSVLVVGERFGADETQARDLLEQTVSFCGEPKLYSMLVARERRPGVPISHYSMKVECQLKTELDERLQVYRVWIKP